MLTIVTRLVAILTSLRHAIAVHTARESRAPTITWLGTQAYRPIEDPNQPAKLPSETWVLLWHRLGRMTNRLQALFTSWQAGTLPAPRPARAPRPYIPRAIPRLPTTPGWINARIAEAAPCAGTLHYLFQEPGLPGFLAAIPQAGRLLRPLCRALGVSAPDWLKLPPRPKSTRALPVQRPPPLGDPHAPQSTADRPLPPYIRAAVRAWKKFDK